MERNMVYWMCKEEQRLIHCTLGVTNFLYRMQILQVADMLYSLIL